MEFKSQVKEKINTHSIARLVFATYIYKIFKYRLGFAGLSILIFSTTLAIFAPHIAPYDPNSYSGPSFSSPNSDHLLGTNDVGQDILSELIFGARVSLLVGIVSATISIIIGVSIGLLSGYSSDTIDSVLMRIVDVILSIPFIPLMIVIGVYFGPGLFTEIIVISGLLWAVSSREIRSKVLSIRDQDHILAAKSMGATKFYIVIYHLLPNVFPIIISQFIRMISIAILLETSLSFLGLGDTTTKSWGTMLFFANARSAFLTDAWLWWVLPPGFFITITVLSFAFMGYVMEEQIRPQLKLPKRIRGKKPVSYFSQSLEKRGKDEYVVRIKNLTVEYPANKCSIKALNGIDLDIRKKKIVGIIGESGSGKSTLAVAILGMLKPPASITEGQILILNHDIAFLSKSNLRQIRGNRIALIPQYSMNALNPVFTVIKQVTESILIHKKITKEEAVSRSYWLLQRVGISSENAKMYPYELSGGMRQRVLIAMALSNEPDLIIADEPTTGLDVIMQAEILKILADLRRCLGLSILLISHDIQVVLSIADEIAVMHSGKIIEKDSAVQICAHQKHPYTNRLFNSVPELNTGQNVSDDKKMITPITKSNNLFGKKKFNPCSSSIIHFSHVKKAFKEQRNRSDNVVLDDVNFHISKSEIVGLIGGSGVGKSTIAKIIAGLLNPDRGDIIFENNNLSGTYSKQKKFSRYIHLIFQDPYNSLPSHMNIRKIIQEPLKIHGLGTKNERDELTIDVLEKVSLIPASAFLERYPHELSGGERQRVALARALILKPSLIVADEPTTMLDASLRLDLLRLMKGFRDEYGISYLYITHDISLASSFCDRLLVMHKGKIVDEGKTEEILAYPNHYYSSALISAAKTIRRLH